LVGCSGGVVAIVPNLQLVPDTMSVPGSLYIESAFANHRLD
jgi:hypothetical protein